MEHLYELVNLLNNYDESISAENRIRDLICFLSDSDENMKNELYRTVIFEAAERLRMFGYIKGPRKIDADEIDNNGSFDVKHQTIQNYYASKVFKNNLLDRRQKEIVDKYMSLDLKRILISAPTSFGKTFLLREILFLNKERYNNILLVFPTIALLNENTESIKELITSLKSDYKIVNNVYSGIDDSGKHIFILTPERTLKLLSDNTDLKIDFFFFDEIYKIDEDFSKDESSSKDENNQNDKEYYEKIDKGNRAKAFRITLYLLSKKVPEFYLAGPYLNLHNLQDGFKKYISTHNVTPIQIDFEPTIRIEIEAWKKKSVVYHPIYGRQELELYQQGTPTTREKISGIAKYIRGNDYGQAIFYCATPARSMDYTKYIVEAFEKSKISDKINVKFIEHLKQKYGVELEGIHKNSSSYWSLITALENGYGIHHGKFPKYIQNEVLKMFNNGDYDFLFCTSTIIEGVNTNAKNVVVINSSVGHAKMSAFALKNIKGRAGRYYHHYIGRVFLTDKTQKQIELQNEIQLDFPTYNNKPILNVDLDSADITDLSPNNYKLKEHRDSSFDFTKLPNNVFVKNRLFARDIQEKLLSFLLISREFNKFTSLIGNTSNIKSFLKERKINLILESLEECEVIDKNKASIYHAVISNYSISGTKGIIKYHIDKHVKDENEKGNDPLKTIDRPYITAFDQIRNIVEYEVPKLLCLFEAIYQRAGEIKGYDMLGFNLSTIIRFFELGVTTEFGLFLVEFGFPIDTIQTLEKKLKRLSDFSVLDAISYLRENNKMVLSVLDEYELELFKHAIQSLENKILY